MAELLSIGGWVFLLMNGPITFAILRFAEKAGDPEFEAKAFKKTIWRKKHGNS